jgi:nitric oxide reductase NorE protein
MNVENTRTLSSPPGGLALWIFITLELITFAGFFLACMLVRNESPALFHESSQHLIPDFAMAHTLLLITGSYLAARASRLERMKASQSFLRPLSAVGFFSF